jgi:RNA polymerase sigma-70 factor (ECF subfamily)
LSRSDLKEQAAEIIEILRDIAYQSGSQDELTGNLTLLRNVCIDANRKDIFDRCLGIAKDGGIDTEDMDGHELRFKYNTDDFANSEEPYREVFELRIFGELSFREIGMIFGKTENWARVTFHRARAKLKERMGEA